MAHNWEPLIRKLDALGQREAFRKAVLKNKLAILKLNFEQLDKGLNANNRSIGKYANFNYKGRFKPVDLKLTGDFRRQFQLDVDDQGIFIWSEDIKTDILVDGWGKDIFGLNTTNAKKLMSIIRADFQRNIKNGVR